MDFEWDENKNKINIEKHGISFKQACDVFLDEYRYDIPDVKHSTAEDRRQVIGMVNKVLFVVYTIRGVNTRIISARVASAKERMLYEYNKNNK